MHYNIIKSDAFIRGNDEQTRPNCLDTRQVHELILYSDPGEGEGKRGKYSKKGDPFFVEEKKN